METGVAREREARRSIHELRGQHVVDHIRLAEVVNVSAEFRGCQERFPAKAQVHGEMRRHLPGVLNIGVYEPLLQIQGIGQRERVGIELTQEELREIGKGPVGLRIDIAIEEHLGDFAAAAKVELLVPFNPTDVVVHLERSAMRSRLAARTGADGKSARHGEPALVRYISAINQGSAHVAGGYIIGGETMNADPIDRGAELIYQSGSDQVSVSHGPGLVRIIQRALRGAQDVIRRKQVRGGPEVVGAKVTAEESVFGADLIIAAADVLPFVDMRR